MADVRIEDLYRKRLEVFTDPEQADYEVLDQGRVGTALRDTHLAQMLKPGGKTVLDLGCGTGLTYKNWADLGVRPLKVLGVDMMEERRGPLLERLNGLHVRGGFVHKPSDLPFHKMKIPDNEHFDICLAIGVVGYYGLHSLKALKALVTFCTLSSVHGAVFVPTVYGVEGMGDAHVQRFAREDLEDLRHGTTLVASGRDTFIIW